MMNSYLDILVCDDIGFPGTDDFLVIAVFNNFASNYRISGL